MRTQGMQMKKVTATKSKKGVWRWICPYCERVNQCEETPEIAYCEEHRREYKVETNEGR
jgi:hypothetical protein